MTRLINMWLELYWLNNYLISIGDTGINMKKKLARLLVLVSLLLIQNDDYITFFFFNFTNNNISNDKHI